MRVRLLRDPALALALALVPACGGGGGSTGAITGNQPPPTTAPPPPTTTPSNPPTLVLVANPLAGQAPLTVGFDACGSRDSSGGSNLTYYASFEGEALARQGGCGFSHRYTSNGVSTWTAQVCVDDARGQRACGNNVVKAYIELSINVSQAGACDSEVTATATEVHGSSDAVRAFALLDRVEFEVFTIAGVSKGKKDGTKNGTSWRVQDWNVGTTEKVRVRAVGYAAGVRGDDVPEGERPAC